MKVLDGKKIANKILGELKEEIFQKNLHPVLGVVLVGDDQASEIYVRLKKKAVKKIGVDCWLSKMKEDITEAEVLEKIKELNRDEKITGIIVQLPLPAHLDKNKIIQSVLPQKDVDGFGLEKTFPPVFPQALWELLQSAEVDLKNKQAIILCNSQEFGGTMQAILEQEGMNVQYLFRFQIPEKGDEIKRADVIISACGQKNLLNASMVKEGVIVVDGGIVRVDGKVCGDVDKESLANFPGYLSPVPGGVGPVTIACLLRNVCLGAERRAKE